jgi:hypothetical protein
MTGGILLLDTGGFRPISVFHLPALSPELHHWK